MMAWRRRSHNNRAWSHNNRNGCCCIPLLWREKYVIKVAEKSVYSTGIFPVINMSPRDMSVITSTSGKKASCQCYQQNFYFIFHKLLLIGFAEILFMVNRQQKIPLLPTCIKIDLSSSNYREQEVILITANLRRLKFIQQQPVHICWQRCRQLF